MNLKRVLYTVCAAVLCLSVAACGSGAPSTAPSNAGSSSSADSPAPVTAITLVESWDFPTFYTVLTAGNANNFGFSYWSKNCYDTLVQYDHSGELVGALAKSWNISDDGLTYTFALRDGVKFSDGTALTSEAVRLSLEAAVVNLGMYNGSYGRVSSLITGMETPDDTTFVMTLAEPYYAALNDLTMSNPLSIVNPKAFAGGTKTAYEACKNITMGTGPYMYAGDGDGTAYTFVRNPHYWGEQPEVDSFTVKVIEDNDAKVLALRSREIDAIISSEHIGYDAFTELSSDSGYGTAIQQQSSVTRYLGFNLSSAPFDDVLVRRAVSHTIDRETLCDVVLGGIESPAYTLMPQDKPYCDIPQTTYQFDPETANALMEQAGWIDSDGDGIREKDGVKLEMALPYTQSLGSIDDMVLAIADQLSQIGFKLTPAGTDMMTWYDLLLAGNYGITYYYTYGGVYDPATLMSNMNPAVSSDPVFVQCAPMVEDGVALIGDLDSTADPRRVQEIYGTFLTEIADQAMLAPFSYSHQMAVWNSNVIDSYGFNPDTRCMTVADFRLKTE